MTPAFRTAAGVLATLALVSPVLTAAAEDDPMPPSWPVVEKPTDGGSGRSDPEPPDFPAVIQPDPGSAEDPVPPAWPAPARG
jgi:hypothetical protein